MQPSRVGMFLFHSHFHVECINDFIATHNRKPYVLDIGCGEGKDAVFFARNGYRVTAFDIADAGLEKARRLAEYHWVEIDFFKGDVNDFRLDQEFDIIMTGCFIRMKRLCLTVTVEMSHIGIAWIY